MKVRARAGYAATAERNRELRARARELLGGVCSWGECTWNDPRALEIHHVKLDGGDERSLGPMKVVRRILEHPERYRLLCSNHHRVLHAEARKSP